MTNGLSAIILCRANDKLLEAAIRSLTFATEIILAVDGKIETIGKINASPLIRKIALSPNLSFASKRNEALSFASQDWVLFIDSDEQVSPVLAKSIETAIKTSTFSGYQMKRSDFFMGSRLRFGETGSMWLLRLAKKSATLSSGGWKRRVHEVWNIEGPIGKLKGEIMHTPHSTLESFFEKINRYTELEVEERVGSFLRVITIFQLLFYPPAKFIQNYVFKLGFLDGYPGLIMAWMMSFHSLCVRIKMLEKK